MVIPEDQVVMRNDEAMLHCQFTAVPPPTLEWYHENEQLVNKSRYVGKPLHRAWSNDAQIIDTITAYSP